MDVISFPDIGVHYRMLFDAHGRLTLTDIDSERAKWKLVRIDGKTTVRGGKTQINFHDGRDHKFRLGPRGPFLTRNKGKELVSFKGIRKGFPEPPEKRNYFQRANP